MFSKLYFLISTAARKGRAFFANRLKPIRLRAVYLWLLNFVVLGLYVIVSPNTGLIEELPFGAEAVTLVVLAATSLILVTIIHLSRKFIFDYVNFKHVYNKCMEHPIGAGLFALSISGAMISFAIVVSAAVK